MIKKLMSMAAIMVILGSATLNVNAYSLNTYAPVTGETPGTGVTIELNENARSDQSYVADAFKNYAQTGKVKLSGTQSISKGYQSTLTSGASTGVQYQIVDGTSAYATIKKYVTRTGVYKGTLSVDLSNANAKGELYLRLANYYNLSFNDQYASYQSASGKFNY